VVGEEAGGHPGNACAEAHKIPGNLERLNISAKIRNARLDRVPYMLVIGQREADEGTVSVRHHDKDDLGTKPLDEFIAEITAEIKSRSL
jgi:threonyl-tRNA synthetase